MRRPDTNNSLPVQKKPVIGISAAHANSQSVSSFLTAVRHQGGIPLFISNHLERGLANVDEMLGKIDGLIVTGNDEGDILPERYIHRYPEGDPRRAPHPRTVPETRHAQGKARAEYEDALMEKALKAGMPVMGICAGSQRLNILHEGGTLHQHVPDLAGHDEHMQGNYQLPISTPIHPISILSGTTLRHIARGAGVTYAPDRKQLPQGTFRVISRHHQAIDRVGKGLRVAAVSDDVINTPDGESRMVEAIEGDPAHYGKQLVLGLQWHPEFAESQLGVNIIKAFTHAAKLFAQENQRIHPVFEADDETTRSIAPQVRAPDDSLPPRTDGVLKKLLRRNQNRGETERG